MLYICFKCGLFRPRRYFSSLGKECKDTFIGFRHKFLGVLVHASYANPKAKGLAIFRIANYTFMAFARAENCLNCHLASEATLRLVHISSF